MIILVLFLHCFLCYLSLFFFFSFTLSGVFYLNHPLHHSFGSLQGMETR
jgi:hypothetical protein